MLEVGCGTGLLTAHIAEVAAEVIAIDPSPELLKIAAARVKSPGVEFRCSSLASLESNGAFDAAVGSSVLHHLDLSEGLRALHSLLVPGGRLVFAEPNLLNPQVFLERALRFLPVFQYVSPDETAFVRWRLGDKLRRFGFEEARVRPFDWLHPAIPGVLIPVMSRVGGVLERCPGIRELSGSLLISARRSW